MAEPARVLPLTSPGCGIFDEHHPPAMDLINQCVHCGFCLPVCPTYALWHEEMDSPRGRIYLMKMGLEGEAQFDLAYVRHFDRCLGCMACITACPSGVKYDKLIEATRAQIERHYPRALSERIFRGLVFAFFPYPSRLRLLLPFLWAYQRLGIRAALRALGLIKFLPPRLRVLEALLPAVSLGMLHSRLPRRMVPPPGAPERAAVGRSGLNAAPRRLRIGLMLGCVQRLFFDQVNAATARVLAAEGCEVLIPPDQQCCGALMTHAGREEQALEFARHMIDVFERENVDAVVINAAGCGSNVKDYAWLLRDDPAYAERAQRFVAKCRDISELLAELGPQTRRHPLPVKVAVQDSCHLQHVQGIRNAPRQLLAAIPGIELMEIADAALCCGSAGIYNLVQPGPAEELGERKVESLLATGAGAVVSGNPGCLLHLKACMQRMGRGVPAFHTIELIDASMRGASLPGKQEPRNRKLAQRR
jgi:glycolate oxidase iron-sulfur subunit